MENPNHPINFDYPLQINLTKRMLKSRKSPRWADYDYRSENLYFVTAVTRNRNQWFGEILAGEMVANEFGKIVEQKWDWLFRNFPFIYPHAFQLMPDHIHGVIELNYSGIPRDENGLLLLADENGEIVPRKVKPLYDLVGAFKMTSSKEIHLAGLLEFGWQRSFHDRVIRSHEEYDRIVEYILMNPLRWEEKARSA